MDGETTRIVVDMAEGAIAVAAGVLGWSAKREVSRRDTDMTALQTKVEEMKDDFVAKDDFRRAADEIKRLLAEHSEQSNRTLTRIEARIDALYQTK